MNKKTLAIVGLIGLILVGGAGFAYYTVKMNKPAFRGRAINVEGVPAQFTKEWEAAFKEALEDEGVLETIVKESDYAAKLEIPEGEAVAHLEKAVRVRLGKGGKTLLIGLETKLKYYKKLDAIIEVLLGSAQKKVVVIAPSYQEFIDLRSQNR